jgi:hypothetical protein
MLLSDFVLPARSPNSHVVYVHGAIELLLLEDAVVYFAKLIPTVSAILARPAFLQSVRSISLPSCTGYNPREFVSHFDIYILDCSQTGNLHELETKKLFYLLLFFFFTDVI